MAAPLKAIRRMFRIQYVSDLHLEFYEKAVFPQLVTPNARYLALAGDIGQPGSRVFQSFLSYVSGNWDRVFYVPGNHEYYAKQPAPKWKYNQPTPFHERHQNLRESVEPYKNIHLLDSLCPSYLCEEENVAIVGSTLWSHVPDERLVDARLEMNDYNYIPFCHSARTELDGKVYGEIRPLHPVDTNQFHTDHRRSISEQIDIWKRRGANVCMITHHMPSFSLVSPRYRKHHLNCCFASSCEDLMQPHVKAWIYGHTHNAAVTAIGNTITACNARGYPNESVSGFGRDVFLEFKTQSGEEEAGDEELQISAREITELDLSSVSAPLQTLMIRNRSRSSSVVSKDQEDIEFM
jgi:predicted phosphodiesterase